MSFPGFGAIPTGGYNRQPTKIQAGAPSSRLNVALSNVLNNDMYGQDKKQYAVDFSDVPIPSMFQSAPPSVNFFNDSGIAPNAQPTQRPIFQHSTMEDEIDDNYHHGKEYMMLLKELSDGSQSKLSIGDLVFSARTQQKHWFFKNSHRFTVGVGIWKLNDMLLTAQTNAALNPKSDQYKKLPPEKQSAMESGMYPQTYNEFLENYNLAGVVSDESESTSRDRYTGNVSRNVMVSTDGMLLMPNLWGAREQGGHAQLMVIELDARNLYPTHHNWKGQLVGPTPAKKVLQVLPYLSTNSPNDSTELNNYLHRLSTEALRTTGDSPIRYPLGIVQEVKGPVPSQENILKALHNYDSYTSLMAHSYVRIRLNLSRLPTFT